MTRDEHIARAEEIAGTTYALYAHLQQVLENADDLDPRTSVFMRGLADQIVARVQAFGTLATTHAKIAEVLGQKDANEPRSDAWKLIDSRLGGIWSTTRNGDVWLVRKFSEGHQSTRHSAGWWIRSVDYPGGTWIGYVDDPDYEVQEQAERFLYRWYGECRKDDPSRTGPGWGPCQCGECRISRAEADA
jgi:hypothetical protein